MEITAYIPGVGHNLQEHSVVLVEAVRLRPSGCPLSHCSEELLTQPALQDRQQGRSKYGTKRPKPGAPAAKKK